MLNAERFSMICTNIILFFCFVPTVIYDNACHHFASILLRLPRSLLGNNLVVDRFHHLKGHICGSTFGADGLRELENERMSNAESMNKSAQYCGVGDACATGELWFVALCVVFLNLIARWRRRSQTVDAECALLSAILNTVMVCMCWRCVDGRQAECGMFASSWEEIKGDLYVGACGWSIGVAAVASIVTQQKRRHMIWKGINFHGMASRAKELFLSSS
jgi:hypothetical protein